MRCRLLILGSLCCPSLTAPTPETVPGAPPDCQASQPRSSSLIQRVSLRERRQDIQVSNRKKRLALLIPGLQDRLLVRSKAEHVVRHLARNNVGVDVFIDVVAQGKGLGPMYVGGSAVLASPEAADAGSIEGPLRDAGASAVEVQIRSRTEDIHMPPRQPEGWDRFSDFQPFNLTGEQSEVGRNILRMFKVLERLMVAADGAAQKVGEPYDYVLFDHDDSEWLGPLQLQQVMDFKASQAAPTPRVFTRGCLEWGGLNDKTLLFTWQAARAVLLRLFSDMYVTDARLNTMNSETFWKAYVGVKGVTSVPVPPGVLPTASSTYRRTGRRAELCQKDLYVCDQFYAGHFRVNTCGNLGRPLALMGSILKRLPLVVMSETARIYRSWCLQFVPSVVAIVVGALMYRVPKLLGIAPFVLFFGGQSFMNLYIKAVLSGCTVDAAGGLHGIPAPFFVTGVQQSVGFAFTAAAVGLSWLTPWPYRPKPLSPRGCLVILSMSLFFCLNIGLNNLSLSMLDLSLNIVLRSSTPVLVALVQLLAAAATGGLLLPRIGGRELGLYALGSLCMACALGARAMESGGGTSSPHLLLGAAWCVLATLSSAGELVLVSCLGLSLGLNPVDVIFYTALPSTALLAVPAVFVPHPAWPGHGAMTDLQVVEKALRLNPHVLGLVLPSGLFALFYNALLYRIVQQFTAPQAALAATANKAVTIVIAGLMGLELLPRSPWLSVLFVFGILGTLGTSLQLGRTRPAK